VSIRLGLIAEMSDKGIMSLPEHGHFWPRRSSSNRRWLAHEIVQQPVNLFRPKSANVLEMPDCIGCLQFSAFCFKSAIRPQITWKSVLHSTAPWRRPRSRLCRVFGATVELVRSLMDKPGSRHRQRTRKIPFERENYQFAIHRLRPNSPVTGGWKITSAY